MFQNIAGNIYYFDFDIFLIFSQTKKFEFCLLCFET